MSTTSGPHPARTWSRGGAHVDLHHSLAGSGLAGRAVGLLGTGRTTPRTRPSRPRPACRACVLAAHGPGMRRRGSAPLRDLKLAPERFERRSRATGRNADPIWRLPGVRCRAGRTYRRRRAGLRAGARRRSDGRVALSTASAPRQAFTLEQLARRPGIAAKAEFVRLRLLPPPQWMRALPAGTARHGGARDRPCVALPVGAGTVDPGHSRVAPRSARGRDVGIHRYRAYGLQIGSPVAIPGLAGGAVTPMSSSAWARSSGPARPPGRRSTTALEEGRLSWDGVGSARIRCGREIVVAPNDDVRAAGAFLGGPARRPAHPARARAVARQRRRARRRRGCVRQATTGSKSTLAAALHAARACARVRRHPGRERGRWRRSMLPGHLG